jgi:hypothetical protein
MKQIPHQRGWALRSACDAWWKTTEPFATQRAFISLGHAAQPAVTLHSASAPRSS